METHHHANAHKKNGFSHGAEVHNFSSYWYSHTHNMYILITFLYSYAHTKPIQITNTMQLSWITSLYIYIYVKRDDESSSTRGENWITGPSCTRVTCSSWCARSIMWCTLQLMGKQPLKAACTLFFFFKVGGGVGWGGGPFRRNLLRGIQPFPGLLQFLSLVQSVQLETPENRSISTRDMASKRNWNIHIEFHSQKYILHVLECLCNILCIHLISLHVMEKLQNWTGTGTNEKKTTFLRADYPQTYSLMENKMP